MRVCVMVRINCLIIILIMLLSGISWSRNSNASGPFDTEHQGIARLNSVIIELRNALKNRLKGTPSYPPIDGDTYFLRSFKNKLERESILLAGMKIPYKWGGESLGGMDCSAFSRFLLDKVTGLKLPRTAKDQANAGVSIGLAYVQPGDLIFFDASKRPGIDHVGVSLTQGGTRFIHCVKPHGVRITTLGNYPFPPVLARRILFRAPVTH